MSVDPLPGSVDNPQSLDRYVNVTDDPVNLTDPLGLCLPGCVCIRTHVGDTLRVSVFCPPTCGIPSTGGGGPRPTGPGGGGSGGGIGGGSGGGGGDGGDHGQRTATGGSGGSAPTTQPQQPSRDSQDFAACVEANRIDNALRDLGSSFNAPFLTQAAELTLTSSAATLEWNVTSAAVTTQLGGNLVASVLVPITHRGPIHATSWQHSAGSLLSRATHSPIPGAIGNLVGKLASAAASAIVVAEGAYNGAAMARCAVLSYLD